MKKIALLTTFLFISILSAFSQANFEFEEMEYNFGNVLEGKDTLWHEFHFKNTGNEPLQISDVRTSCDCTLAEWPKGPIAPGKTAVIKGGFKIADKMGRFDKSIIIIGNTTPATTILNLKGNVYKENPNQREG